MFRLKSGIKTAALITAFILSTGAIVSCGGQENNNSLPDSSSDTASDKKFVNSEKINEVLPGIVCWGDSLTSGPGRNAMSYPTALQNYIDDSISVMCPEAKELGISIPVVNMGVGGEDTNTILGRNGAVPFITSSAFTNAILASSRRTRSALIPVLLDLSAIASEIASETWVFWSNSCPMIWRCGFLCHGNAGVHTMSSI